MTSTSRAIVAALTVSCVAACGEDEEAGLDITLVPDYNIQAEAELLARLGSVLLVVDSDEGLYPESSAQPTGDVRIENADLDAPLELVTTLPLPPERLPRARLQRGSLPGVVSIRVVGLSSGDAARRVAIGGVVAVAFVDEQRISIPVPFNLLPELLPLRVSSVTPTDGETVDFADFSRVTLTFSREVDSSTLRAAGAVTIDGIPPPLTIHVDARGRTANVSWGSDLVPAVYTLTVSSDVRDADGGNLDQSPLEAGRQPFTSRFVVPDSLVTGPVFQCGSGPRCPFDDLRIRCDNTEGICVLDTCDDVVCAVSLVCDPSTIACEGDCRFYGAGAFCPSGRPTCNSQSGLCVD